MIKAFFTAVILGAGASVGVDLVKICVNKLTDADTIANVKEKIKRLFN